MTVAVTAGLQRRKGNVYAYRNSKGNKTIRIPRWLSPIQRARARYEWPSSISAAVQAKKIGWDDVVRMNKRGHASLIVQQRFISKQT